MKLIIVALISLISPLTAFADNAYGPGYACVAGYLYKPDGKYESVGASACASAKLGNGYACVAGYLYKQNGTYESVGAAACSNANLGN